MRDYLMGLITAGHLPRPLRAEKFSRFVTTGFLPPRFRDEMKLPWTDHDQRRFDRMLQRLGTVLRRLPGPVRRVPFNVLIWDLRLRRRLGRPLV